MPSRAKPAACMEEIYVRYNGRKSQPSRIEPEQLASERWIERSRDHGGHDAGRQARGRVPTKGRAE